MRVTVFTECRCALNAQGEVCTLNGPRTYPFWQRYHAVFSEVTVAARLSAETGTGSRVTGPGVSFWPLPTYHGAAGYLRVRRELARSIHAAARQDSAFILRVPSRLGVLAARALRRMGKPYGIEVVGDPYDVFGPGGVHHPLRPFLRRRLAADLRKVAHHAAVAMYVTEEALQHRYPCPSGMIGVSDVDLSGSALAESWKRPQREGRSFRVVSVGSLAQPYKGQDVLLEAGALCLENGLDLTLVFVGDGVYRAPLEARAKELGIAGRVLFRGRLPAGPAVRAELDQADLFVMASRAEGLPRALVEAMARGLPCLASRVGGIPELLAEDDLLVPGDAVSTAAAIERALRDPARLARMAQRSHARAQDFAEEKLMEKRKCFYAKVLEVSTGVTAGKMTT